MIKKLFNRYFELSCWILAMVCLAFNNPANHSHFSLCPLKNLGISWCPGCGLGHAISYLFRGDLKSSFHAHWLGIPAVLGIFYRIYTLLKPVDYKNRMATEPGEKSFTQEN